MPAPLAVDKEQVRMLVMEVGAAKAARHTGLKEGTIRQWCKRHGWTEGNADKAQLAQGEPTPARTALAATLPESLRPVIVTGVTKPADALKEMLAEDSRETRLGFSRALRRAAKHAEDMPAAEVLEQAQNVKALIGGASQVHGWQEAGGAATTVVNIALIGRSLEPEG